MSNKESVASPASYHQEWVWRSIQFGSEAKCFLLPLVLRLEGRLNADVLEKSVNEVVRRHEALRSRITRDTGSLEQLVVPDARIRLARHDQARSPEPTSLETVLERALDGASSSFAADGDLPICAQLFEVADDEAILVLVLHRLVADRYSLRLVASG